MAVLLGLSEVRDEADGDEECTVLAADDLELRHILIVASGTEAPHGIASNELGDAWSEVARFQGNLLGRSAHAHGQRAMFTALQGRGVRLQTKFDEQHRELRRVALCTRDLNRGWAGRQLHWRKNYQ